MHMKNFPEAAVFIRAAQFIKLFRDAVDVGRKLYGSKPLIE
jgi:hypothetical protein